MSEDNPVLITDPDGHTPTALDLVIDYIKSVTPGYAADSIKASYTPDGTGLTRFVEEIPGDVLLTHGTTVGLEVPRIIITVRADTYQAAKDETLRLRYLLASVPAYASRGLDLIAAIPVGTIDDLGKDAKGRQAFETKFDLWTGPSYT